MTNEEKAREICGCGNCYHNLKESECLKDNGILCCLKPCFKATLEAMEWKDEQHDKEKESFFKEYRKEILDACIYDFEQKKQQLIDKACEWLAVNDSYAKPTNVQVDRLREYLNNLK